MPLRKPLASIKFQSCVALVVIAVLVVVIVILVVVVVVIIIVVIVIDVLDVLVKSPCLYTRSSHSCIALL